MRSGTEFNFEGYGEYMAFLSGLGEDNSREHSRLRANLSRAITEELTERQMQLITMYYIDGMSMKEIAKALSVNVSTVSRTLSRGRSRLRRCLKYGAGELLS
jgi:RNA polymerase sigma-70 factor (ECF subfamily)